MKEDIIDGKFEFYGENPCTGKIVSHHNAVVFKASDVLLPDLLLDYIDKLSKAGAKKEQIEAVKFLRERIIQWQTRNPFDVKVADLNQCEIDAGIAGRTLGKKR